MKIHITFLMRGMLPARDPHSRPAPAAARWLPAGVLDMRELASGALAAGWLLAGVLDTG